MSLLDEVIAKGLEWFNKFRYSLPRLPYADADFTRNLWIISMKKGIREVIKAHEPYANPRLLTTLVAVLNKCIAKLYGNPQLYDYCKKIVEEVYNQAKYGVFVGVTLTIYGLTSRGLLLTMGMGI